MPEGPFGFKRASTFGPLTRETEEELRQAWSDCEADARDDIDRQICQIIKRESVTIIESQSIKPCAQTLEEINSGLCGYVTNHVLVEFDNPEIKEIETGGMNWLHRFIEYRGRYFDAESPTGVDNPSELMFHQRLGVDRDADELFVVSTSDEVNTAL